MVSFRPACPVCALARQLDRARQAAVRLWVDVAEFPLFFAESGEEVEKPAAVATIYRLAELLGHSIVCPAGGYLFGGHSLRTGGAAMLASRGLDPMRIQSMDRWKSPLAVHYAVSTGLAGIVERNVLAAIGTDTADQAVLRRLIHGPAGR